MQAILKTFFGEDEAVLADVQTAANIVKFSPGSVILSEEDTDRSVFYLLSGKANTVRYSSEGAEVWLDELLPGSLFGEMTALGAAKRTATIVAANAVSVAVFTDKAFVALMEKHGSIGLQVSRLLVARVERTTRRMFELAAISSKGRVYAELLRRAEAIEGSEQAIIRKMPSMSAMARQINNTRETVSRTINELEKDGLILRENGELTILAPDALRGMQG